MDWILPDDAFLPQWKCKQRVQGAIASFESEDGHRSTTNDTKEQDTYVRGTFNIWTPAGKGIPDFSVDLVENRKAAPVPDSLSRTTDADGSVDLLLLKSTPFLLKATKEEYQDLYIVGVTPAEDFTYTTYMGTRQGAVAMTKILGIPYNESLGWVVVG